MNRVRRVGLGLLVLGVLAGAGLAVAALVADGPDVALAGDVTSTTPSSAAPTTDPPTTSRPTTTLPPTTLPPTPAPPTTTPPPETPVDGLRSGAEGDEVLALQTALDALGFWLGEIDGRYASLTQQAVMAFQKANGLSRDGIAGPETLAALATAVRPTPAVLADGIEVDLERQLILIVQGGTVTHALNTSTGRSGWRTPTGTFAVEREINGMRHAPLGDLYRPKYFYGGIAVHGSGSIPGQPASHGCARVSFAAMDMVWDLGLAEIGTQVVVY